MSEAVQDNPQTDPLTVEHSISFAFKGRFAFQAARLVLKSSSGSRRPTDQQLDVLARKIDAYKKEKPLPIDCQFFLGRNAEAAFVLFVVSGRDITSGHGARSRSSKYLEACFTVGCAEVLAIDPYARHRDRSNLSQVKTILQSAGLDWA